VQRRRGGLDRRTLRSPRRAARHGPAPARETEDVIGGRQQRLFDGFEPFRKDIANSEEDLGLTLVK